MFAVPAIAGICSGCSGTTPPVSRRSEYSPHIPACFLATKLEAFADRGRGDFLGHDLEDVIAVIDGRPSIEKEVESASPEIRTSLRGSSRDS